MKFKTFHFSSGLIFRPLRYFIALMAATLLYGSIAVAEMRVWEDTSGKQVKARFDRELFGSVELRRPDGSLYSIPLENLSPQDLRYLRTRIPPEIEIEVRTLKREKERNKNATRSEFEQFSDEIEVVTANVLIRQKSSADFEGALRAEIYFIGREVATPEIYRLSAKSTAQVRLTEENQRKFAFGSSADFRIYEEYNKDTRGADYVGYLVVVLDAMGKKLKTRTNVSWLDEDEKIDALRKFYVDAFFDANCRKRSVPRPSYYDARNEF